MSGATYLHQTYQPTHVLEFYDHPIAYLTTKDEFVIWVGSSIERDIWLVLQLTPEGRARFEAKADDWYTTQRKATACTALAIDGGEIQRRWAVDLSRVGDKWLSEKGVF